MDNDCIDEDAFFSTLYKRSGDNFESTPTKSREPHRAFQQVPRSVQTKVRQCKSCKLICVYCVMIYCDLTTVPLKVLVCWPKHNIYIIYIVVTIKNGELCLYGIFVFGVFHWLVLSCWLPGHWSVVLLANAGRIYWAARERANGHHQLPSKQIACAFHFKWPLCIRQCHFEDILYIMYRCGIIRTLY